MIIKTIGDRAWHYGITVATLSLTPLYDRCAKVKRIRITAPSAADTWTVSVGGKEIFRAPVDTAGNQHLFGLQEQAAPIFFDVFTWVHKILCRDMSIPVPQGQTLTVASVGGATANVSIQFEEWTAQSVLGTELNGQYAKHFLIPVFAYLNTAVTGAGPTSVDTRIAPPWLPNFFLPTSGFSNAIFPTNWKGLIHALFLDGTGVNTFSGAADHKSNTQYLHVERNAQVLFTRDNTGVPMPGQAAASGSANTSYLGAIENLPDFDHSLFTTTNKLDNPIECEPGDSFLWALGFAGDFTGNPSYAHSYVATIAEIWQG